MHDHPPPKPFYFFLPKEKKTLFASIIKVPPKPNQSIPKYQELVCTQEDQALIYEVISTIAEHGKVGILFRISHLKEIEAKIDHVHPLKFLETIFSNPYLKECMWDIFDDYFKRSGFMDGLNPSLSREAELGRLFIYLQEFADRVNVPLAHIEPLFQSRSWEELVYRLMGR